jgi:hypothetical protein
MSHPVSGVGGLLVALVSLLTLQKNRYIPVPIFTKHGAPFQKITEAVSTYKYAM